MSKAIKEEVLYEVKNKYSTLSIVKLTYGYREPIISVKTTLTDKACADKWTYIPLSYAFLRRFLEEISKEHSKKEVERELNIKLEG